MPLAHLMHRVVLSVAGEDARSFLSGLVTCAVEGERARYGALLTPQGKIIADFFLVGAPDGSQGFLVDVAAPVAETLLKRLTLYKLRAKVAVARTELGVLASFGEGNIAVEGATGFVDPRLEAMGHRLIGEPALLAEHCDAPLDAYEAHRIGLAMPEGGRDFAYGDAFPHEASMNQLGGVDFDKGCYVGQEVVSRTEHRGTARTRVARLTFSGSAPAEGSEVSAAGKAIGKVGSVDAAGRCAIALLRLDRLADAYAAGAALSAGDAQVSAQKPAWARYAFPEIASEERR